MQNGLNCYKNASKAYACKGFLVVLYNLYKKNNVYHFFLCFLLVIFGIFSFFALLNENGKKHFNRIASILLSWRILSFYQVVFIFKSIFTIISRVYYDGCVAKMSKQWSANVWNANYRRLYALKNIGFSGIYVVNESVNITLAWKLHYIVKMKIEIQQRKCKLFSKIQIYLCNSHSCTIMIDYKHLHRCNKNHWCIFSLLYLKKTACKCAFAFFPLWIFRFFFAR